MSIQGALQIGRSAIATTQAAIQVTGNNMANAATPGYHRQVASFEPSRPDSVGRNQLVGTGVQLQRIGRAVDVALIGRLRQAIGEEQSAMVDQRFLSSVETIHNELTDNDLSSLMGNFFNGFSELANSPADGAIRSVVIQQGVSLAQRFTALRADLGGLRNEIDGALGATVRTADNLLDQIAQLNLEVTLTEQGLTEASSLRDQRDSLVDELSQYLDVTTIEQPNGAYNVLVGSTPVVIGAQALGIELHTTTVAGVPAVDVRLRSDGTTLQVGSGSIGGLLHQRAETVAPAIDQLDTLATQLIYEVNRLHSQGQGQEGFTTLTGTTEAGSNTAILNSATTDLPFPIEHGSFLIHVTNSASGARLTYQIDVDGDTMSLQDLVNQINTVVGVPNVTASISPNREFQLDASAGYEISFSEDSSGALTSLGVNTFFTGRNGSDIDVNGILQSHPNFLVAGLGHVGGSNGTALAISDLRDAPIDALGGRSLAEYWQTSINDYAVRSSAANANVEAATIVRESISAQERAVSGVSLDEEAINLLNFQRQFQAAARFVSTVDEMLQTLLQMVA